MGLPYDKDLNHARTYWGSKRLVSANTQSVVKKTISIEQASKVVPLENLCLSPQCGFSSTHHGNNLTVEQEKAKLKLCIDTANEVWGTA